MTLGKPTQTQRSKKHTESDLIVGNPRKFDIDRAAIWVDVASKVAAVLLVFFALLQYYEAGREKQRERSLQLVDRWLETDNPSRLARISQYLEIAAKEASDEVASVGEELYDRAWQNATRNMFAAIAEPVTDPARNVRGDIDVLMQFFSQAEACVSSNVCDPDVVQAFFEVEARSIRKELDPLIVMLRADSLPNYGFALDRLLKGFGP
jgi:hypothetical protein